METKKSMYINFFDRNGVFMQAVPNGTKITGSIEAGWTAKISFEEIEMCRCGDPCHVWSEDCPYND